MSASRHGRRTRVDGHAEGFRPSPSEGVFKMNKWNKLLLISAVVSAMAVTGCSSKGAKDGAGRKGSTSGLSTGGAGTGSATGRDMTGGIDLNQHIVYFDFDSSELKAEEIKVDD